MSRWSAEALDPVDGEPQRRPWPEEAKLSLRAAPGADGVLVRLLDGDEPVGLFETSAPSGAVITLRLGARGVPTVEPAGEPVFHLPPETPAARPRPAVTSEALDLALVIDATRLHLRPPDPESVPEAVPLLEEAEAWAAECRGLVGWLEELRRPAEDCRLTVLAFGDRPAPFPVAADLRPSYLLRPSPAERRFEPFSADGLMHRLGALPPSSGGDAVDAVAEALHAAAALPWRPEARRLAVLVGDSPAYSIEDPAPAGASSFARAQSLETARIALFEKSVDVATVFTPPARGPVVADAWQGLLEAAERHYRRLGSLPAWAQRPGEHGLAGLAPPRSLLEPPRWIGLGPTLGFFAEGAP